MPTSDAKLLCDVYNKVNSYSIINRKQHKSCQKNSLKSFLVNLKFTLFLSIFSIYFDTANKGSFIHTGGMSTNFTPEVCI